MDIETFYYAKRLADSIGNLEDVIKDYQGIIDSRNSEGSEFPVRLCVEDRRYFYMNIPNFKKIIMEHLKQELDKQKKEFEAI